MSDSIELPLIDLASSDIDAAGKAILDAAITYGFLYIDSRSTVFTPEAVSQIFGMVRQVVSNFAWTSCIYNVAGKAEYRCLLGKKLVDRLCWCLHKQVC
jgi:hypothetical protein